MNQSFARWIPRIAGLVVLVIALMAAFRVSTKERSITDATENVHGPKQITVAVPDGKPPFFTIKGDGGREWALIRSALLETGHHVGRPLFVPLADAVNLLNRGLVDAIWLSPASEPTEAARWHLSAPLLSRDLVAITLVDRALTLTTVDDLRGKKVGSLPAAEGLLGRVLVSRITDFCSYEVCRTDSLMLLKLFEGRLDVILSERSTFDYYRQLLPASVGRDQAVVYHEIFPPSYPRLAFRDVVLRDEFNAALAKITSDEVHRLDAVKGAQPASTVMTGGSQ